MEWTRIDLTNVEPNETGLINNCLSCISCTGYEMTHKWFFMQMQNIYGAFIYSTMQRFHTSQPCKLWWSVVLGKLKLFLAQAMP